MMARVFAVADSFDAATTDRPYRPARTVPAAVKDIAGKSGQWYDPSVIKAFKYAVEQNCFTPSARNSSPCDGDVTWAAPASCYPHGHRPAMEAVAHPWRLDLDRGFRVNIEAAVRS